MPNLLLVQSSPNLAASATRKLSAQFAEAYAASHPGTEVTIRDMVEKPVPHLGTDLFAAFFSPPESHSPA